MKTLLFVDEEPELQNKVRFAQGHSADEWDIVYTFTSDAALDALRKGTFDAVVAAQRLPGMPGVQLLDEIRKRAPETVRILLGKPADHDAIQKGLNSVHQYLPKPCEGEEVLATAMRACDLKRLLGKPSVRQLVSGLRTLPSLPSLYVELENELRSPDSSLKAVAAIIASDPAMSAKILQLINSPFFGLRTNVRDLTQAVTYLGLNTIKALVLSVQVFSQFRTLPPSVFRIESLWAHSMRTAALARKLARLEQRPSAEIETAFLGGLLHDIGILALAANLRQEYVDLLKHAQSTSTDAAEAETRMFGATHAEVGAYLLGLWGLGDDIVEILAYNHTPCGSLATTFSPVTAVHIANALEYESAAREAVWASAHIDEECLAHLKLLNRLPAWREAANEMFLGGESPS